MGLETTMCTRLVPLVLAVLLLMPLGGRTDGGQKPSPLTAEDKIYLDSLLKEFLFDPQGAERVAVKTLVRTAKGASSEEICEGWLVRGQDGAPDRVYFADGASISAPPEPERKKVDFPARCRCVSPQGAKKTIWISRNAFESRADFGTWTNSRKTLRLLLGCTDSVKKRWPHRLSPKLAVSLEIAAKTCVN